MWYSWLGELVCCSVCGIQRLRQTMDTCGRDEKDRRKNVYKCPDCFARRISKDDLKHNSKLFAFVGDNIKRYGKMASISIMPLIIHRRLMEMNQGD